MPKRTIKFRNLSGGLRLAGDAGDGAPRNVMRRNRGIHPVSENIFESRDGSTQLHALNAAHSLTYFDDFWIAGASTQLYAAADSIKTGLSGDRLSFTRMQPTAGTRDRLFVAGGDDLVKVDPFFSIVNDGYQWTASGSGTNEYYCDVDGGGDPGLTAPAALLINGSVVTEGTAGSLTAGQWDWADNDTLGYSTVYVRLTGGGDPDAQDDDHIEIVYCEDWGIEPPTETLSAADGGAGGALDDGAIYSYRLTYYNERTGTRSNPTSAASGTSPDAFTKLLLNCDGADTHTTFTDTSPSGHTVTAVNSAQGDTAQKKFGTASLMVELDTSDYCTVPDHADWNFGGDNFTIDFWVRFESVGADAGLISQYADASNYWTFEFDTDNDQLFFRSASVVSGIVSFYTGVSTFSPSTGTWYHIAIIRGWDGSGDKFAITVDGSQIGATSTDSSEMADIAAVLEIGRTQRGSRYLDGWMDEIRVSKGIARWTDDFTVPASAYGAAAVDLGGGSTSVDLTGIPASVDPQVTHVEIWRTQGGGSAYFLATRVADGVTTYTDDIPDTALGTDELPTNNLVPYSWFDDCFGPYNASMFWITRSQGGERGRLYYSPVGRAEAVDGFIEVTNDDTGLQRGIIWGGGVFVVGEDGWWQIYGTNPYFSRPISGVPGTTQPHTVVGVPGGIMYEAPDGVRMFTGSASRLVSTKADIQRLFRGKTGGALTAFTGVVADYARGEYFISDETQLLALNIEGGTWRDVGDLSIKSIHYAKDADIIGAGTNADGIYDLENEGDTQDNSNDIEKDIETDRVRVADDKTNIVLHVHVDYEVETLT
jgi:hypothetical protein